MYTAAFSVAVVVSICFLGDSVFFALSVFTASSVVDFTNTLLYNVLLMSFDCLCLITTLWLFKRGVDRLAKKSSEVGSSVSSNAVPFVVVIVFESCSVSEQQTVVRPQQRQHASFVGRISGLGLVDASLHSLRLTARQLHWQSSGRGSARAQDVRACAAQELPLALWPDAWSLWSWRSQFH